MPVSFRVKYAVLEYACAVLEHVYAALEHA